MKNRSLTEANIIQAVDRIILEKGFQGLGVNSVAAEAGISKVLIYRYFGDMNGLLEAWAVKNSYWSGQVQPPEPEDTGLDSAHDMFAGQIDSFRRSPLRREIQRWLMASGSPSAGKVLAELERKGMAITETFRRGAPINPSADMDGVVALLSAGITHLALMSDRCKVYNGVPLDTEEGWERIEAAAGWILKNLYEVR